MQMSVSLALGTSAPEQDGAPLALESSSRIRLLSDGQRLVIGTVLNSDAGSYECRAANRAGTVWGSAELLVPEEDTVTRVVAPVVVLLGLLLIGLIACLVWKNRQQQVRGTGGEGRGGEGRGEEGRGEEGRIVTGMDFLEHTSVRRMRMY